MNPKYIVIHCSDTEDGDGNDWESIRRYHKEHNGWLDIGYHFGLEYENGVIRLRRGRTPVSHGAHCKARGLNGASLGVCVVGDFDENPPDDHITGRASILTAILCIIFNIPILNVIGHGEVDSGKTCPGKKFDMQDFRGRVSQMVDFFGIIGLEE